MTHKLIIDVFYNLEGGKSWVGQNLHLGAALSGGGRQPPEPQSLLREKRKPGKAAGL